MIEIVCCPPDLCEAVIEKCEATILRGLAVAPEITRAELLERLEAQTALMWMVLRDKNCLAIGFTEIVPEDNAVAVFGLAGRDMWRWAKPLFEAISQYAQKEGAKRVVFAGKRGWARMLPGVTLAGTRQGQAIFERRTLQ